MTLTRNQARKIAPEYVRFIDGDYGALNTVLAAFGTLKRGQRVLTYLDGQFVQAKVSGINHNSFQAVDGPVVRVATPQGSWRVDGDRYAFPY
jgi:hypothetical protein